MNIIKKYEYKVISMASFGIFDIEKKLNKYGRNGWELVSIYQDKFILKREINEIILS